MEFNPVETESVKDSETESGKDYDDAVETYSVCSVGTGSEKGEDDDMAMAFPEYFTETESEKDRDDDSSDETSDDGSDYSDEDDDDTGDGNSDDYGSDYSEEGNDSGGGFFEQSYGVYPFSQAGKAHLELGNKIILPLAALEELMEMNVGFPMLFKLEKPDNGLTTHCGVLEFSADEGTALLPEWVMTLLSLPDRGRVSITNVNLEKASYVKLRPHSVGFLGIRNPKEALESAFCTGYACLTVGDTVVIAYEGKSFEVDIVDARPSSAVCVIDTDCEVDFAPPLDYVEPVREVADEKETAAMFVPFSGKARRLIEDDGHHIDPYAGPKTDEPRKGTARVVFGGVSRNPLVKTRGESVDRQMNDDANKVFKAFSGKKYSLID